MDLNFDNGYEAIPSHMQEAILSYVKNGRLTGDFLQAIVSNDLFKAVGHADMKNLPLIPLYVQWFFNRAPMGCIGSAEAVRLWCEKGGLEVDCDNRAIHAAQLAR
jgi:hypothetical protein